MKNNLILFVSRRGHKLIKPLEKVAYEHQFVTVESNLKSLLIGAAKLAKILAFTRGKNTILTDTPQNIGFVVWFLSKTFNVKYIYRARGDAMAELDEKKKNIHAWFHANYFLKDAQAHIAVSNYLACQIKKSLPEKFDNVFVVPTPQSTKINKLINSERKSEILIVTNFGFRTKIQPLIDFLPAVDELLSKYPYYSVKVVGGGRYLSEFEKAVSVLKNKMKFSCCGKITDVSEFYLTSKILLYVSGLDAYPSVINEAHAFGVPVVCNKVGGIEDQVKHNTTGFFIDLESSKSLMEVIEILQNDYDWLRIAENGLERIENNNSYEFVGRSLVRIVNQEACR